MKIFILILQIALSLWNIIGGVYMINNYQSLANDWALNNLPNVFWVIFAIVQILLAIGLLISIKDNTLQKLATPSAIGLTIFAVTGAFIYSAYAGFPGMLWAIIPAGLLILVACKRRV